MRAVRDARVCGLVIRLYNAIVSCFQTQAETLGDKHHPALIDSFQESRIVIQPTITNLRATNSSYLAFAPCRSASRVNNQPRHERKQSLSLPACHHRTDKSKNIDADAHLDHSAGKHHHRCSHFDALNKSNKAIHDVVSA